MAVSRKAFIAAQTFANMATPNVWRFSGRLKNLEELEWGEQCSRLKSYIKSARTEGAEGVVAALGNRKNRKQFARLSFGLGGSFFRVETLCFSMFF